MLKVHTLLFGLLSLSASLVFTNTLYAKELSQSGFEQYVVELKAEALTHGFTQSLIDNSFAKVKFHKRAVSADRKQPEKVETLDTYLPKRVPNWKVKKARVLFKQHQQILSEIGNKYGVQPRFIVALWGLETNFGKFTGGYNVVSALST
jgi:membrane-bound lytic murein transglycosylase B